MAQHNQSPPSGDLGGNIFGKKGGFLFAIVDLMTNKKRLPTNSRIIFTAENGFTQSSQGCKDAIVFFHKGAKAQRFKKSLLLIAPLSFRRGVGGEVFQFMRE
jgi:hypothetical protein